MPTPAPPDELKSRIQVASIVFAIAVLLNGAFYFLSQMYYDGKMSKQGLLGDITQATVNHTRLTFVVFTVVVVAATIATLFAAKWVSHGIAGLGAIASLIAGVYAWRGGMPGALSASLFVIGIVMPLLVWRSLVHSRAAWAFLMSMCYVLALVLFFGAPKVRAQIDIGLWTAMIIPGLFAIAGAGMTMSRREYSTIA